MRKKGKNCDFVVVQDISRLVELVLVVVILVVNGKSNLRAQRPQYITCLKRNYLCAIVVGKFSLQALPNFLFRFTT